MNNQKAILGANAAIEELKEVAAGLDNILNTQAGLHEMLKLQMQSAELGLMEQGIRAAEKLIECRLALGLDVSDNYLSLLKLRNNYTLILSKQNPLLN